MFQVPQRIFKVSILIGVLSTLPFVILEAVYTSGFSKSGFPAAFPYMFLLSSMFTFTSVSIVRKIKGEKDGQTLLIILGAALVLFLGSHWVYFVIDQWPCFLGATGC